MQEGWLENNLKCFQFLFLVSVLHNKTEGDSEIAALLGIILIGIGTSAGSIRCGSEAGVIGKNWGLFILGCSIQHVVY